MCYWQFVSLLLTDIQIYDRSAQYYVVRHYMLSVIVAFEGWNKSLLNETRYKY